MPAPANDEPFHPLNDDDAEWVGEPVDPSDPVFSEGTVVGVLVPSADFQLPPPPPPPAAPPPAPIRAARVVNPQQPPPPTPAPPPPEPSAPVASHSVRPFRPTQRPTTALLVLLDDGQTEGEVIRLRRDLYILGRNDADVIIPNDPAVAARHVEITRQPPGNRWQITDLSEGAGLFIRVSRGQLTHGSEFLIGQGRYRFEVPHPEEAATVNYDPSGKALPPPNLIEILPDGTPGTKVPLMEAVTWIGRDPGCTIVRSDDPFLEARHAKITRPASGTGPWAIEHNRTLNGLWLKISQLTVREKCFFQIGEQRCLLTSPEDWALRKTKGRGASA